MTTLELQEFADERPGTNGFFGLRHILASIKLWYDRRQTLARLSQLDEHQLRDVGFDPADVHDALNGEDALLWEKWEKLHGEPETR
jgi:uncharacterized protein YjiS (DUF1127 family)